MRRLGNPRVLLISANREPFPEPVFPLGTAYIANALQETGSDVRIFDARYNSLLRGLRNELEDFRPDSIGISLRNIDNASYPACRFYLPSYSSLIQAIRRCSNAPIILGGPAFSLFSQEIMSYLWADHGIIGEGESAVDLFSGHENNGLTNPGHADLNKVAIPKNISRIFPDFSKYRTIGIQTARGCPNSCIYCTYPSLEGRKRRPRPPLVVADEIARLHRDFGIEDFFVVDSIFNADEDHMVNVLTGIANLKLPIRFSCYMQPRVSDPSIFHLMKKAGCVAVDFGTDAGSPHLLNALRKPFITDQIVTASRACNKAGIDFCHSLIFGGPGESDQTIRETIELMDEVSPRAVIAMTGIRIYPRTNLHDIALDEGYLNREEALLEPRFYFSALGPKALLNSVYRHTEGKRNWFFPGRKDWSSTIGYRFLYFIFRKGPLWRTFRK